MRFGTSANVPVRRNPITGIADCCTRAVIGHAAAPATPAINERRFMGRPAGDRLPQRAPAVLRTIPAASPRPAAFAGVKEIARALEATEPNSRFKARTVADRPRWAPLGLLGGRRESHGLAAYLGA
jgi:hypothetical protein